VNLEQREMVLEEIMKEFIILLKPSPFMLNNLFLIAYTYLVDLGNLRPKKVNHFALSKFRGFVIICFGF
jgi:hypothetical protein